MPDSFSVPFWISTSPLLLKATLMNEVPAPVLRNGPFSADGARGFRDLEIAARTEGNGPSDRTETPSVVDLKFLSFLRHARHRNFKSKTTLESIYLLVSL